LLKIQTLAPSAIKLETIAELQEAVNKCEIIHTGWQKSITELETLITKIKPARERTTPKIETKEEKLEAPKKKGLLGFLKKKKETTREEF